MKDIMMQAEAVEAVDSVKPKRSNKGKKLPRVKDYLEETKLVIDRIEKGESTFYKIASELNLDHQTVRNRVRKVRAYLKENPSDK